MPLIKVTSSDGKVTKLLAANDIKTLRLRGILSFSLKKSEIPSDF
jgi:hypothetical protein